MKNKNGFTLIELLAVIVIIGILLAISISAITHFVDKSRSEQKSSQAKMVEMAAENFLQEHRGSLPRKMGETKNIFLNILKENNYLTEDVVDSSGQNCMASSYVAVYKESQTKYTYTAHLICE